MLYSHRQGRWFGLYGAHKVSMVQLIVFSLSEDAYKPKLQV
jgi:hypothetical protein